LGSLPSRPSSAGEARCRSAFGARLHLDLELDLVADRDDAGLEQRVELLALINSGPDRGPVRIGA
jgi:hypothetical protein